MPSDQSDLVAPAIEVSAITEAELQKPVVAKFLYKQYVEMKQDKQGLKFNLDAERLRREQVTTQFSQVDAKRQVLEERLSGLGNRTAISQLIWGAVAIALSLEIDSLRSGNWSGALLLTALIIVMGIAVYLVNRARKVS
jgi:hypothetical protein